MKQQCIYLIENVDCGALFTNEEEIRSKLSHRAPAHAASIQDKWFGTFQELVLSTVALLLY